MCLKSVTLEGAEEWLNLRNQITEYVTEQLHQVWSPDMLPNPGELPRLPYGKKFCAYAIDKFAQMIPNLHKQFNEMEKQLQELYNTLEPDNIDMLMEGGSCEQCPSSGRE